MFTALPKKILVLLGAAALGIAAPAHAAVTLTGSGTGTALTVSGSGGGTASINFNGFSNASTIAGLTGKLTLTFDSIVGNAYKFLFTIENTSAAPITASRLSAFGFNVGPNITGSSSTTAGNFASVGFNANFANGVNGVEACFKDVANGTCTGNQGGVTFADRSDSGALFLNFGAPFPGSIRLDNFAVRYQSIDAPTLGIFGGSATGRPVAPVPEPGTWLTMLLGFAAIGFVLRRRSGAHAPRIRFA